MDDRSRHRQFEERFVAQLRGRALALIRGKLPADHLAVEPTAEGVDSVRSELARLEVFDRDAIEKLPGTRSCEFTFSRKHLGGLFYKTVSRVRVRTLAPVEPLVKSQPARPVGREDVLDALARYTLLPRRSQPTGVILASPTGFTPEAKVLAEGSGNPTLVLMGGREDGGWDVTMPPRLKGTPWAKLLELESQDERLKRLLYHLNENTHLVDSRGISLRELSEKLGVSESEAELLVRQACRAEPRLMTVAHDGVTHVARTPLAEEHSQMSLWSRVRKLLRMKPTVAERVKEMTIQRVRIEQERHEVDQKTDALEAQERQSIQAGAAATSDAERKQLAGKLVRVRTEMKRLKAQAQNLTNALDVIGTHIHHLTLAEQNRRLELPKAEEITREAAQAEQMAAELSANADLARSIEVGAASATQLDEEAAILEEFKQAAAERAGPSAAGAAAGASGAAAGSGARIGAAGLSEPQAPARGAARAPGTPPPLPEKREAKPEIG
ncbi:MAG: hypothetical protein HZB38_18155 [Planctomycetes bacterium]|nr:hypothetical protein [Planctomycetota bacterium]